MYIIFREQSYINIVESLSISLCFSGFNSYDLPYRNWNYLQIFLYTNFVELFYFGKKLFRYKWHMTINPSVGFILEIFIIFFTGGSTRYSWNKNIQC